MRLTGGLSWPRRLWRLARSPIIVAISVLAIWIVAARGYNYVATSYFSPYDPADNSPIGVEIPRGTSVTGIASLLYDNDVIRNKAIFKMYVDFMGKGRQLRAGNYVLTKSMSIDDIIDRLIAGDAKRKTVPPFPILEGSTIETIAALMKEKGLIKDTARFLSLCKAGEAFMDQEFIASIPTKSRKYRLEGYLFPDSYEFFEDTTEEVIIAKLLNRFYNIFNDEYIARAQELGMTMDQTVTLASLIEKEARPNDFGRVSAVFHNRLKEGMKLQSDATISYILGSRKLYLTNADTSTNSPYNTYKYAGLPTGPICNPGGAAIYAALYPDEAFIEQKYLYFCLQDPEKSSDLVFSKTLQEHNAQVKKYQQIWKDIDAAANAR